jgi:hypothetical protein
MIVMYRGKSGHPRVVQTYKLISDNIAEISYIKCMGNKRVQVRKMVPLDDIYCRKGAPNEKTRSVC